MASKTTNYGLNKHSPQDFYNVEARNENWDKIDEALAAADPTKITAKAEPADSDGVMIADSADGGKAKRLLWSGVKTALGKLFVPLARKVNGKTLAKDVTLTGENIAVSTADPTPISAAIKYHTNPNLLDNWYFVNPVNQRGQMEYITTGYTVDRWRITDGVAATLQGGALNISYTVAGWNLTTFLDNVLIPGATYTLSCLYKATVNPIRLVCSWGANKYFFNEQAPISDDWALAEITGTIPTDASIDANQIVIQSLNTGSGSFSIKAAKLELGGTQTLAHKENEKWVLNEIPDFGEQLRRCVYYAEKIEDENTPVITNATFIPAGATSATFVLPYERKRTPPSIRFNDVSNYRVIVRSMSGNTSAFGISNISILDVGTTKASVLVTFSSATSQDWYGYLQRADNTSGGYAFISADL